VAVLWRREHMELKVELEVEVCRSDVGKFDIE